MTTRRSKVAAAGVLALALPLAPSAEAAPLYRFDQPRTQVSAQAVAAQESAGAELAERASVVLASVDESRRAAYEAAFDDAGAALTRACAALVAIEDDETPAWQAITEVDEAETGLLAARAHVKYVRAELSDGPARRALDAVEGQLLDLLGVLESR